MTVTLNIASEEEKILNLVKRKLLIMNMLNIFCLIRKGWNVPILKEHKCVPDDVH